MIKKDPGIDPQLLTNREKTLLIDALREAYTLSELFAQVRLPRSSYFYHKARLRLPDKYANVRHAVTNIFELNHRCYGYRRIRAVLSRRGITLSEKVVRRLMTEEMLVVSTTKRRRYSAYRGEISPAAENLVNRNFRAGSPNQKWLTDITEFQLPGGKVYLSPMIDCFDGLVVSWAISTRPDAALVNSMLDVARIRCRHRDFCGYTYCEESQRLRPTLLIWLPSVLSFDIPVKVKTSLLNEMIDHIICSWIVLKQLCSIRITIILRRNYIFDRKLKNIPKLFIRFQC